ARDPWGHNLAMHPAAGQVCPSENAGDAPSKCLGTVPQSSTPPFQIVDLQIDDVASSYMLRLIASVTNGTNADDVGVMIGFLSPTDACEVEPASFLNLFARAGAVWRMVILASVIVVLGTVVRALTRGATS